MYLAGGGTWNGLRMYLTIKNWFSLSARGALKLKGTCPCLEAVPRDTDKPWPMHSAQEILFGVGTRKRIWIWLIKQYESIVYTLHSARLGCDYPSLCCWGWLLGASCWLFRNVNSSIFVAFFVAAVRTDKRKWLMCVCMRVNVTRCGWLSSSRRQQWVMADRGEFWELRRCIDLLSLTFHCKAADICSCPARTTCHNINYRPDLTLNNELYCWRLRICNMCRHPTAALPQRLPMLPVLPMLQSHSPALASLRRLLSGRFAWLGMGISHH